MELTLKTKGQAVEGRVVTVAVNMIGVLDYQQDISMPGSFTKTLGENFKNIRHYLNHDTDILIGCPISGKEENGALTFESEIVETELGNDILALYKLYQKHENTLQHSIGVYAKKRDSADPRKVLEWKLDEFSTLTKLGACPGTHLINIKSMDVETNPMKTVEMLNDVLRSSFAAKTKEQAAEAVAIISKAMQGKALLAICPDCGFIFDYSSMNERSISNDVRNTYLNTLRWMAMDAARDAAYSQSNEVLSEVSRMIGTRKSLEQLEHYVECPKCYSRVYRDDIITVNEEKSIGEPTEATHDKHEPEDATRLLKMLASNINH